MSGIIIQYLGFRPTRRRRRSGGRSARGPRNCTPIGKPASEREQAHREFNLLTEAYDTLKDAERREAYDEELRSSRQLTRVESKGRPPGAFAMGLAFGLLLAGAALGAKFFLDRSARAPKNQDFLQDHQGPAAASRGGALASGQRHGCGPNRHWQPEASSGARTGGNARSRGSNKGCGEGSSAGRDRRASRYPGHGRRCPCHGSKPSTSRTAL